MGLLQKLIAALAISSLLLLSACGQDDRKPTALPKAATKDYQTYSHDNLKLKYPQHWNFVLDNTPGLYADRTVTFETPEDSTFSIYIYDSASTSSSGVADRLEEALSLNSGVNIKDYQRDVTDISGLKGVTLSWKNTLIGIVASEMTVLQISDSPKAVIAVFHLVDNDITSESSQITPITRSITFK